MHTLENIQKISLIFFIAIGLTHMLAGLMVSNGYLVETSGLVNRSLDIPFVVTGLLYGLSSLRLNLARDEKNHTILDASLVILAVAIFLSVLIINLSVSNL